MAIGEAPFDWQQAARDGWNSKWFQPQDGVASLQSDYVGVAGDALQKTQKQLRPMWRDRCSITSPMRTYAAVRLLLLSGLDIRSARSCARAVLWL